jgi:hypothetical protein
VFDDEIHEMAPDARSWTVSNLSPVNAGALARALELVEEIGRAVIYARLWRVRGERPWRRACLGGSRRRNS